MSHGKGRKGEGAGEVLVGHLGRLKNERRPPPLLTHRNIAITTVIHHQIYQNQSKKTCRIEEMMCHIEQIKP